jgi:S1-C subfamily serine protease
LRSEGARGTLGSMRAGLLGVLVFAAFACGSKASTGPRVPDDDLDLRAASAPAAEAIASDDARSVAPPGKGLRTGTIARDRLVAVLDAGLGTFLRQLEVAPRLSGDRFLGWQLVQLVDRQGPLHDVDLVPGDVLLAINGKPLSRPEQAQILWDSLRTANEVSARMWRGDQKLELRFTIDPPVH